MTKTMTTRLLVIIALVLFASSSVWCQKKQTIAQQIESKTKSLVDTIVQVKNSTASDADKESSIRAEFSFGTHPDLFSMCLVQATLPGADKSRAAFVKAVDEARIDKQVGGAAASSGSTSL